MNRNTKIWLSVALVLTLVGAAVGFYLWRMPPPAAPEVAEEAKPDAGAEGPKVSVDEGESLLKELGKGLGSNLEQYLKEESLLRRLVAATAQIADGESPRAVLSFLQPKGDYAVLAVKEKGPPPPKVKKKGKVVKPQIPRRWYPDPKGFARYDGITGTLTGIDAKAAGEVYAKLRPFAEAAYSEIGKPGTTLDARLRQAITHLLAAPVPEGEPELVEKGALYAYKDEKLEALSAAQKHLLRMGPKNQTAVQAWLGQLEAALPPKS